MCVCVCVCVCERMRKRNSPLAFSWYTEQAFSVEMSQLNKRGDFRCDHLPKMNSSIKERKRNKKMFEYNYK